MFVTLKLPNGSQNGTGLEQVASEQANRHGSRMHSGRKPVCIACQRKKLRCTGGGARCDRCKSRSIPCVFPTVPTKQRNIGSSSAQDVSAERPRSSAGRQAAEPGQNEIRKGNSLHLSEPQDSRPSIVNGNHLMEGNLFDSMSFDHEIPPLPIDLDDLDHSHLPLDDGMLMDMMVSNQNDPFQPERLQYELNQANLQKIPQPLHPRSSDLPAMLTLNTVISSNESSAPQSIRDPSHASSISQNTNSSLFGVAAGSHEDSNSGDRSTCSCMVNTVRVVQHLDDDSFKITTLSLDQVLQLQKWIIAQCCKPLDCETCHLLSTVQTVLVIICDRLAEMFECIHKRIRRANAPSPGHGDSSDQGSSSSWEPSSGNTDRSEQLYCTSSNGAASKANCNPILFSAEFQSMYSDEEQVHMIRVLLKLQMRNFRSLLTRVDHVSQIGSNAARRARVKSMMIRLMKAEADIDNALRAVLHRFAAR